MMDTLMEKLLSNEKQNKEAVVKKKKCPECGEQIVQKEKGYPVKWFWCDNCTEYYFAAKKPDHKAPLHGLKGKISG